MNTQTLQVLQVLIAMAIGLGAVYIGWLSKRKSEGTSLRHISTIELPRVPQWQDYGTNAANPTAMIETQNLRKTFLSKKRGKNATVEAVQGITFSVARGEIFGLLGPNGAGKTTTMRMLSTLLSPTSGSVWIDGYDLSR